MYQQVEGSSGMRKRTQDIVMNWGLVRGLNLKLTKDTEIGTSEGSSGMCELAHNT